jgi:hypothetical protein
MTGMIIGKDKLPSLDHFGSALEQLMDLSVSTLDWQEIEHFTHWCETVCLEEVEMGAVFYLIDFRCTMVIALVTPVDSAASTRSFNIVLGRFQLRSTTERIKR